jgi:polygalacturonase
MLRGRTLEPSVQPDMMHPLKTLISVLAVGARALASPAPAPTAAPSLENVVYKRDNSSCIFSRTDGYSSASVSKTACSTIVLSALTVPAGQTLNLEGLKDGTTVSQSHNHENSRTFVLTNRQGSSQG